MVKGYSAPVIVQAGSPPAVYTLEPLADWDYNFDDPDLLRFTSVLNGKRTDVVRGRYATAMLVVTGLTVATRAPLQALLGLTVTFYPYGQGTYVEGGITYTRPSFSAIVEKAKPFHLHQAMWSDALRLELISVNYYTLSMPAGGGS